MKESVLHALILKLLRFLYLLSDYLFITISLIPTIVNIFTADNSHHLLLKTILQESVCELGLEKNGEKGQNGRPERDLAVYRETFETRFLKETTQYYQTESSSFIER